MKQIPDSKWQCLKSASKEVELNLDKNYRRSNGCYYTDLDLAKSMIDELFSIMDKDFISTISEKKFLEPCVGTGNFVFAYLSKIKELNLPPDQNQAIVENIYVSDVNSVSLNYFKQTYQEFVKSEFSISLDDNYFKNHISNGLLIDLNRTNPEYIRIQDVFPQVQTFDIIATNPPYKNLKAERDQFSSESSYENCKMIYEKVVDLSKKILRYSTSGVLNLYKLFVEEIVDKYACKGCKIALLIPNTILSDKSCSSLRTYIINSGKIHSVRIIPEKNPYIDAQQSLCTLIYTKGLDNDYVKIVKDYYNNPDAETNVSISDILNDKTDNAIFAVDRQEYELLKQLRKFPTVSDFTFIMNLRGELDLTAAKKYILSEKTNYKLVRGRNISSFFIHNEPTEYVSNSFISVTKKSNYIFKKRIACQQISNVGKEQRLCFSLINEGYVLANSCNFMYVEDNDYGIDVYALLGLMNSKILNWMFKLTSSNNHVNNYELDSLPIPTDVAGLRRLSSTVQNYLDTRDEGLLTKINDIVSCLYNSEVSRKEHTIDDVSSIEQSFYDDISKIDSTITVDQCKLLLDGNESLESYLALNDHTAFDVRVIKSMYEKYKLIKNGCVLNHYSFKLSDLDLEMISSIPPGGNWKNIPQETVLKSKRLQQITASGGRTTLYGRIDYDSPCYTISTYFNRPGNGTFVHPKYNRVISPREAARFQSFKDNYYFVGTKGSILKQIGNAVPPLMAQAIGKKLVSMAGCKTSIDLFCGAGGMTVGFKDAGIKSIVANDFNEDACVTLCVNNPEIPIICGDITTDVVKDEIVQTAHYHNVDLICGGPPCQGFSLAGKRFIDDPRNQLFKDFINIVERVKPKVVVMENVEGLLTFSKGEIYNQILDLYSKLGYHTEGRVLKAVDYGVPQKRKRVIIIATRSDMNFIPSDLYPDIIENLKQVTARDVLSDLEDVPCGPNAKYVSGPKSDYAYYMRNMKPICSVEIRKKVVQTKLF